MGNYGCCQSSTIVVEESKTGEMPESNKNIESFNPNEFEEPKILEPEQKHKNKNKKLHKVKKNENSKENEEQKTVTRQKKESFKFNRGGFIHITHGDVEKYYTIISAIGKGSFGFVYKANHIATNTLRAIKVLKKESIKTEVHKRLLEEVQILKSLDHPNILKIFEVYEDSHSINIITELCTGGELFDRIVHCKCFSENKAAHFLYQIMSAVLTCHEKGIVHRDLKPENMIFSSEFEDAVLKIIDFGTSKQLEPNTTLTSLTGTAYYIAPEVILGNYDCKCDI